MKKFSVEMEVREGFKKVQVEAKNQKEAWGKAMEVQKPGVVVAIEEIK